MIISNQLRNINKLTRSTSEFNAIDTEENHGGNSTETSENKREMRSS